MRKTSLVDFPGRVCSAFFLPGCNLRCPYCYNAALVLPGQLSEAGRTASLAELYGHLERRKNVISGLAISGGEPLLHPALPEIIRTAKKLGLRVKLDTNGTLPEKLDALLSSPETRPDFIAMDVKTSPERYRALLAPTDGGPQADFAAALAQSAKLVSSLPCGAREFRTVLVPGLVEEADIRAIARLLPQDARWMFAPFQNEGCLDAQFGRLAPYTDGQAAALIAAARTVISGAEFR